MSLTSVLRTFAGGLAAAIVTFNSAKADSDTDSWRIWLEPTFMRTKVSAPFAGAQKTELAGGRIEADGTLIPFDKAEFESLGWDWELFSGLAQYNAAADLPSLRYHFERNRRNVIAYARVESDRPVVASVVLIPGFLDLWASTLGEEVLVVVPNRFTAFIFPRLASEYLEYAPMILREYRATPYPVSVEVFELSKGGFRCIGAYQQP